MPAEEKSLPSGFHGHEPEAIDHRNPPKAPTPPPATVHKRDDAFHRITPEKLAPAKAAAAATTAPVTEKKNNA
jgi:hypothetical protein